MSPKRTTHDRSTPTSALVIAAHPDDAEFECGATLAKWASRGCVVHYLICTDGSKGTWDASVDPVALVKTRQLEQERAARCIGATGEIHFLGAVDGELDSDLRNRREVARVIRTTTPEVVLSHDPWTRWRLHPDHHHAGKLAVEGIVAARDPLFFPDLGIERHRPDTLLLFESEEPDHFENASGFESLKVEALLQHESQFETTMVIGDQNDADARAFAEREIVEMADTGHLADLPLAEAFKRIDDL